MNTVAKRFEQMRHDPNFHLGLGDIRLTVGDQEEIVAIITQLEDELEQVYMDLAGEDI